MKGVRVLSGPGLSLLVVLFAQPQVAAQELVDHCFEVIHGEWSPALELGGDSIYLGLPSRVLFTRNPPPSWRLEEGFQLETAEGALPSIHRVRQWRTSESGVDVVWSNGFSGVQGTFKLGEKTIEGTLRTFWDSSRPTQTADARLVPVKCSAPHDEDRVARRYLPRSIELTSGHHLELGTPIPEIAGLEADPVGGLSRFIRGAGALGVPNVPEIAITPSDNGLIRRIRIQFPDQQAFEIVLTRLVDSLGPGLRDDPYHRESQEDWRQTWSSRDTQLSLWKARLESGGWLYQLLLYDPRVWRDQQTPGTGLDGLRNPGDLRQHITLNVCRNAANTRIALEPSN